MTFLNICVFLVIGFLFVNGLDLQLDTLNRSRLVQPPPVFWRWSQTGQPQTQRPQTQTLSNGLSERARSSVVTMELVEPKGDSYAAWMLLYDPHHMSKNPITHGSYQRDNPPVWIGDLSKSVEDRIRPTEEILLMGRRTKLSHGPRRKRNANKVSLMVHLSIQ